MYENYLANYVVFYTFGAQKFQCFEFECKRALGIPECCRMFFLENNTNEK